MYLISNGTACISKNEMYRYYLTREWNADGLRVLFIMLNPSTADASKDDPTILRCIYRAIAEGFGSLEVVNLFAYRATDPNVLATVSDPVGPDNIAALETAVDRADRIVCAWGVHGFRVPSDSPVWGTLRGRQLWCLGRTRDGSPRHPLYVRKSTGLERFFPLGELNGQNNSA